MVGLLFIGFVILFLFHSSIAYCPPSACGRTNISYPFRLQSDPISCGDYQYNLTCENNWTVLYLINGGKYYVQAINYDNFTIRVVDVGVDKDDCSTTPTFPLTSDSFDFKDPYSLYKHEQNSSDRYTWEKLSAETIGFIKCPHPVKSSLYLDTSPCVNGSNSSTNSSLSHPGVYSYVYIGDMRGFDLWDGCSLEMVSVLPREDAENRSSSYVDIHRDLALGFELSWYNINCRKCTSRTCSIDSRGGSHCALPFWDVGTLLQILWSLRAIITYLCMSLVARGLCATPCVSALLIYKWRRRHLSGYNAIEEFLQTQNNLMPIRYAYSDIKKMTGGFKEMLGKGGFGSVYKGKLRSSQFAAIKMLESSKAKGQDFISEVATIGRIHHANVVQMIGFCSEGSKQALIYEFMSNGSLDNHIFGTDGSISLSWEKLYEISLGVARGIEYLHRGCDIQILHFDIKPHNILLSENFTPKISDFGLAKFYPAKGSIASLTAARGTIGYMAPELVYKNIGRVSYKADVYSFGMLLLEMAGKRRNLNPVTGNLSQIYYPFLVYDKLSNGKLEIGDATEEEIEMCQKMIVTGLWCIQMQPSERPQMNKVIEMLEGDLQNLKLPPRPMLYPGESTGNDEGESASMSVEFEESSSLMQNRSY